MRLRARTLSSEGADGGLLGRGSKGAHLLFYSLTSVQSVETEEECQSLQGG